MENVILVIHLILAVGLIGIVLLQRSEGGGLGLGGGGGAMTGRQAATAMTKLFNFTSNVASVIMFAIGGHMFWLLGLCMAAGAMLGGWFISPLVGAGTINDGSFSVGSLVVSLLGAVILLAIVNLFRRGSAR